MSDWLFAETELAEQLGLSKDAVSEARKGLVKGHHWARVKKAVRYSKDGRRWLLFALGLPDPDHVAAVMDAERPREVVLAKLTRKFSNKRIVGAEIDGRAIRIRVPSSVKFLPGMQVPCREIDGDLYELVGRCPRWRGKF